MLQIGGFDTIAIVCMEIGLALGTVALSENKLLRRLHSEQKWSLFLYDIRCLSLFIEAEPALTIKGQVYFG